MAFNFGTPAGSSTPAFSFNAASTPAFGASPSLAKTSSTPLFGAASAPSFFGSAAPSPFAPAGQQQQQPGQQPQPSLFGGAAQTTAPALSFSSTPAPATNLFGQQQQQQQQGLSFGLTGASTQPGVQQHTTGTPPDDSAIKELQSIKDSYISAPNNYRYRFQYLFLNVVENPAQRIKPADVDELQWREALRRAGGPNNPNNLWPVQAQGFKALLARKAAQDEAIKEHASRLENLQKAIASIDSQHEAVLRNQLQKIDALEGRFAHAMGLRSTSPHNLLQKLSSQLSSIEESVASGSARGLQGKCDSLVAATRLRAGSSGGGGGNSISEVESSVDAGSLASAYSVLREYAEALERMQGVVKRCARDLSVLEELKGKE